MVPVIVYVVVAVALQVTVAPVDALRPVAGDQLYVLPPDAVIPVDEPVQYDDETGVTVSTGSALTVIA